MPSPLAHGESAMTDAELIGGRFRRKALLGTGAMGQVWLATDERLQRAVAVKVVIPDGVDSTLNERLAREARAAAAVQHVNVVRVFDYIEDQGQTLIVMEYVEGETLRECLTRGPMTEDVAAEIVAQVCDGLAAAHRLNLVHRDLKPANVILTSEGIAKVVDFGLAKRMDNEDAKLTQSGMVLGTPQYMAPEQFTGDELDGRTDVHAAGMLLYELLSGTPTFNGDTLAQLMFRIVSAEASLTSLAALNVSPAVLSVISVALQKKPADRWQTATEMAEALRFAAFGEGSRARKTPRATPTPVSGRQVLEKHGAPVSPSPTSLTTSQAIRVAILRALPKRRIRATAALAAVAVVVVVSIRRYAESDAKLASATVPTVGASPRPSDATAEPSAPGNTAPATAAIAPAAVAPAASAPAANAPQLPSKTTTDDNRAARDPESSEREVRAALATAVKAKWRVFAASLGSRGRNGTDSLRASFAVQLDSRGELTDIRPEAMSGMAAFDNMAAEAIQNVNRVELGSARSASGWRFRVQMLGQSVRVSR